MGDIKMYKIPKMSLKPYVEKKMLSIFIESTKNVFFYYINEKCNLFNRYLRLYKSTKITGCRRVNRTYTNAERKYQKQCIDNAWDELMTYNKHLTNGGIDNDIKVHFNKLKNVLLEMKKI